MDIFLNNSNDIEFINNDFKYTNGINEYITRVKLKLFTNKINYFNLLNNKYSFIGQLIDDGSDLWYYLKSNDINALSSVIKNDLRFLVDEGIFTSYNVVSFNFIRGHLSIDLEFIKDDNKTIQSFEL